MNGISNSAYCGVPLIQINGRSGTSLGCVPTPRPTVGCQGAAAGARPETGGSPAPGTHASCGSKPAAAARRRLISNNAAWATVRLHSNGTGGAACSACSCVTGVELCFPRSSRRCRIGCCGGYRCTCQPPQLVRTNTRLQQTQENATRNTTLQRRTRSA